MADNTENAVKTDRAGRAQAQRAGLKADRSDGLKEEQNGQDMEIFGMNEEDEERRRQRRAERRAQMRREKERMERINRLVKIGAIPVACVLCVLIIVFVRVGASAETPEGSPDSGVYAGAESNENESTAENKEAEAGVNSGGNADSGADEASAGNADSGADEESAGNAGSQESEENAKGADDKTEAVSAAAASGVTTGGASSAAQTADGMIQVGEVEFKAGMEARSTSLTNNNVTSDVDSSHTILINESDNTIVAARDAMTKIYPASMTKVLTVLVAAEHVTNLDDTFTITIDITDYAYVNDCSAVGFLDDETVTVRDLFYGTVLPSGGDAALGLATYVAGSQEAFVELMNDKLEELGLSDTAHFTNCVGLYDDDHYCTTYDMAIIMKAAMENDLCREVLSAHTYTTSSTSQHPEGITISNWFLRRIEDKDSAGLVLCGKTGFVNQSGSCAVSYFISDSGVPYICVTADAYSSWRCIYDHVAMYQTYTK